MKNIYTYLAVAGVVVVAPMGVWAEPVWGYGEVITQMVDNTQSNAVSDLFQTQSDLVESTLKGMKGSYSSGFVKKKLKKALTPSSEAITGQYEGLSNILGKNSSYGQIKVKKCGANIPAVVERVKKSLVLPATENDRAEMTTSEQNKRESNRNTAIETASKTTLAKAWIVETESANIAESISNTKKELKKSNSQMKALVEILRLQEETQKNINTRLSLMGDELISTGLGALDSGI